jgi:ribonuclease-3
MSEVASNNQESGSKPKSKPRKKAAAQPRAVEQLARRLGITMRKPELLRQAVIHKSAEQELTLPANERLEFLGDAVLGLAVAGYLYRTYPGLPEGDLTKFKAVAVSETILAEVAQDLGLGRFLVLSKGEEQSGGRTRGSLLADALEAVFGAIYLDRGQITARRVILDLLREKLSAIERAEHELDYKTLLQEQVQEVHRTPPTYRVVDEQGPDHDRTFVAEVRVGGKVLGRGVGKSKKQAEQAAAREALGKE